MSFFVNLGYSFRIPEGADPDGSLILASAMPMHQMDRRLFQDSHLQRRLFDPQLYLAGLDVAVARNHCAKLASYPWFNVNGFGDYDSGLQTLQSWTKNARALIGSAWPSSPPADQHTIQIATRECVDFQRRIGCWGVILPSPLTVEPGTDYAVELSWLDEALAYVATLEDFDLPVFATVALSDVCVRFLDPENNPLLEIISDSVSAREIHGVYILLEQASEADDSRHCANSRALRSVLHLVRTFAHDVGIRVGINFLGSFGLVCKAAGAEWWASNWYKSLYRVRLADRVAGGRAFPTYWSFPAACDVNLNGDLDALVGAGLLPQVTDHTSASAGLLSALESGAPASSVPAWAYGMSNILAAREHYLLSSIAQDRNLAAQADIARLDSVNEWLEQATVTADQIATVVGSSGRTKTDHVIAWRDALRAYRTDQSD